MKKFITKNIYAIVFLPVILFFVGYMIEFDRDCFPTKKVVTTSQDIAKK